MLDISYLTTENDEVNSTRLIYVCEKKYCLAQKVEMIRLYKHDSRLTSLAYSHLYKHITNQHLVINTLYIELIHSILG